MMIRSLMSKLLCTLSQNLLPQVILQHSRSTPAHICCTCWICVGCRALWIGVCIACWWVVVLVVGTSLALVFLTVCRWRGFYRSRWPWESAYWLLYRTPFCSFFLQQQHSLFKTRRWSFYNNNYNSVIKIKRLHNNSNNNHYNYYSYNRTPIRSTTRAQHRYELWEEHM